jgi:hypothetical protein
MALASQRRPALVPPIRDGRNKPRINAISERANPTMRKILFNHADLPRVPAGGQSLSALRQGGLQPIVPQPPQGILRYSATAAISQAAP